MKKRIITAIAVLLVVGFGFLWYTSKVAAHRERALGAAMTSAAEGEMTLNEVVPFAWDAVYTFAPYTSKEQIEAEIGFRSNRIRETVSEGMTQLVFVKGKRVAMMVCGYPDRLGYDVDFDGKITYEENAVFTVTKDGEVTCFTKKV